MSLRPSVTTKGNFEAGQVSPRGAVKRAVAGGSMKSPDDIEADNGNNGVGHGNTSSTNTNSNSSKHVLEDRRRKNSFRQTSYGVIFLTALTLYISIMLANFAVFDVLGGKRDIRFASLLWGIINTAISCMNLSILRNGVVPLMAKFTSNTTEATRMLFDETLTQPMSRLWVGLMVGVLFTYAATGFSLPPWTQLRFSATSYTVAVAWSFSLLSTFQQLSSGE